MEVGLSWPRLVLAPSRRVRGMAPADATAGGKLTGKVHRPTLDGSEHAPAIACQGLHLGMQRAQKSLSKRRPIRRGQGGQERGWGKK